MTEKNDCYAKISLFLGWEKNRKKKIICFFAGIIAGGLTALAAIYSLLNIISKFGLQSIGVFFAVWIIIAAIIAALLTLFFGYKNIGAVIKNPVFKWSAAAAMCLIIIVFVASLIMLMTHPISIGPW